MINQAVEELKRIGSCAPAMTWCQRRGFATLADAWVECQRANWLLWLAGLRCGKRQSPSHRYYVRCLCQCARHAVPDICVEDRPAVAEAVEVLGRWGLASNDGDLAPVSAMMGGAGICYPSYVYGIGSVILRKHAAAGNGDAVARAIVATSSMSMPALAEVVWAWYPEIPRDMAI